MKERNTKLTSPEIGALWGTYMNNTMAWCLITYFLHHIKDSEIEKILQKSLDFTNLQIQKITTIFNEENIPVPDGFTEKDINLTTPPLFNDPFALSFVYNMGRLDMIFYSFTIVNTARHDITSFFSAALSDASKLYEDAVALMLSKGIYDRPPNIPYPTEVKYIKKETYTNGIFHKRRPLNVSELTEIFFNIERNYFSILLCTGYLQVVRDKEVKEYIRKGKEISTKQIKFFNDLLFKEDLLGITTVNMEVTDSQDSPFSDKLIMNLFNTLNALDISLLGHSLSTSLRTDLSVQISKIIAEILSYTKDGFDLMVNRGWLEEPPAAPDRRALENSE
ncbi:DUF3231 family protein [Heyndrickxia oleronia]|uniref:DUF3231 family protein n=1 Tax=Heyndrickxia oleronia TaxID=38875 RepID=A0AAW6T209_9BACI|nr:DUF3231 family protein [Heyndrickxia oleronia]MDH5163117.1 DUF3231 family protein [Heyndrickxia oleronia]